MKLPEIPPEVARAVMEDMAAYFAAPDQFKSDEIAAEAMARLQPFMPKRAKRLRLSDVKELFRQMQDS